MDQSALYGVVSGINFTLLGSGLTPIQVEATLVTLLVLLGVQEAWLVSMTPPKSTSQRQD